MVEGGCFCGEIRYSFNSGKYYTSDCHCSMCRRISGAAFVSWMAIPNNDFEYTKGKPKELISSSFGKRYFCGDCGTPLVCLLDQDQKNTYITICTLDQPNQYVPKTSIFNEDMLAWIRSKNA